MVGGSGWRHVVPRSTEENCTCRAGYLLLPGLMKPFAGERGARARQSIPLLRGLGKGNGTGVIYLLHLYLPNRIGGVGEPEQPARGPRGGGRGGGRPSTSLCQVGGGGGWGGGQPMRTCGHKQSFSPTKAVWVPGTQPRKAQKGTGQETHGFSSQPEGRGKARTEVGASFIFLGTGEEKLITFNKPLSSRPPPRLHYLYFCSQRLRGKEGRFVSESAEW